MNGAVNAAPRVAVWEAVNPERAFAWSRFDGPWRPDLFDNFAPYRDGWWRRRRGAHLLVTDPSLPQLAITEA